MDKYEKLNNFIASKIRPWQSSCSEVCDALRVCDWLIQKYGEFTYTSYPDKQQHTVKEGLLKVMEMLDKIYSDQYVICSEYNEELLKAYQREQQVPNRKEILQQIEILKSLI